MMQSDTIWIISDEWVVLFIVVYARPNGHSWVGIIVDSAVLTSLARDNDYKKNSLTVVLLYV